MLKLTDFEKDDNYYYSTEPIKLIGKDCGEGLTIEIEADGLKLENEIEGLSKYIEWLNSKECLEAITEALKGEDIEFDYWYPEIEIEYASILILGAGVYATNILTDSGISIAFEGEKNVEIYFEDDMSME